jgi:hypothetical protein
MDTSFESNRQYIERELKKHRLEVTPEAWRPVQRINFKKLVQIHDHEERFLRTVFIESLRRAHRLRISSSGGTSKINAHDVATALLMLGSAVESASEGSIAPANKALIKAVCPYC